MFRYMNTFLLSCCVLTSNFIFSYTIEKTIPNNSTYACVMAKDGVDSLLYKLLSPSLKAEIYPTGLKNSSVHKIITSLKKLNIDSVEAFTNPEWNLLIKIDTTKIKEVVLVLRAILLQEGFSPKIKQLNTNNYRIGSQDPNLVDSHFFLKQEGTYTLITMDTSAFQAWKSRATAFDFYNDAPQIFKKNNLVGFFYGIDNVFSPKTPQLITLYTDETLKNLDVERIQKNIDTSHVFMPNFLSPDPMFYFSTMEKFNNSTITMLKTLFSTAYMFIPSLRWPISTFLTPDIGLEAMSVYLVSGDIVSLNEKQFDKMDLGLVFHFNNPKKIEQLIMAQDNHAGMKVSVQSSGNQRFFTIKYASPQLLAEGFLPIFVVLDQKTGNLLCSMNKPSVLEVARRMNQYSIQQQGKPSQYAIYFNISKLVDNFPILNSLALQSGIDLKAVKEITQPNTFKTVPSLMGSDTIVILTANIKLN